MVSVPSRRWNLHLQYFAAAADNLRFGGAVLAGLLCTGAAELGGRAPWLLWVALLLQTGLQGGLALWSDYELYRDARAERRRLKASCASLQSSRFASQVERPRASRRTSCIIPTPSCQASASWPRPHGRGRSFVQWRSKGVARSLGLGGLPEPQWHVGSATPVRHRAR